MRKTFGAKKEEVREGWRKLHSEELHECNTSLIITRVNKSRKIMWHSWGRRKISQNSGWET
jgi:hypothetical protein